MGIDGRCISDEKTKTDRIFGISQNTLKSYCSHYECYGSGIEKDKIRLNADHFQGVVAQEYKEANQGENPDVGMIERMTYEFFLEPCPDKDNAKIKGYYPSQKDVLEPSFLATSMWVCRQKRVPECCGKLYLAGLIEVPLWNMRSQNEADIMAMYWDIFKDFEKEQWKRNNSGHETDEFVSRFEGCVFGKLNKKQAGEVHSMVQECIRSCMNEVADAASLCYGINHYEYISDETVQKYIERAMDFVLEKGVRNELN